MSLDWGVWLITRGSQGKSDSELALWQYLELELPQILQQGTMSALERLAEHLVLKLKSYHLGSLGVGTTVVCEQGLKGTVKRIYQDQFSECGNKYGSWNLVWW